MLKYWLSSDRNKSGTGPNVAGLTYWIGKGGSLNVIDDWRKANRGVLEQGGVMI